MYSITSYADRPANSSIYIVTNHNITKLNYLQRRVYPFTDATKLRGNQSELKGYSLIWFLH